MKKIITTLSIFIWSLTVNAEDLCVQLFNSTANRGIYTQASLRDLPASSEVAELGQGSFGTVYRIRHSDGTVEVRKDYSQGKATQIRANDPIESAAEKNPMFIFSGLGAGDMFASFNYLNTYTRLYKEEYQHDSLEADYQALKFLKKHEKELFQGNLQVVKPLGIVNEHTIRLQYIEGHDLYRLFKNKLLPESEVQKLNEKLERVRQEFYKRVQDIKEVRVETIQPLLFLGTEFDIETPKKVQLQIIETGQSFKVLLKLDNIILDNNGNLFLIDPW